MADVPVDPLDQTRENRPRSDLHERVHAFADELLRRLREPHRRRQLLDQERAHPPRGLDPGGHGRHQRGRRLRELDALERRPQPDDLKPTCGFHLQVEASGSAPLPPEGGSHLII